MDHISVWHSGPATLGEGIIFDARHSKLFWLDIKQATLFESDPEAPGAVAWDIEGDFGPTIGCIVPDPDSGGFLAATAKGFVRIRCDFAERTAEVEHLVDPEEDLPGNRFNDGSLDPFGGFWAGTMHDAESETTGNWWRWDGQNATKVVSGFHVTNGPVFLPSDDKRLTVFLTDSAAAKVYKTSWSSSGELGPLEIWAEFDAAYGYPDGMCIDRQGRLWITFWDGAAIRAFDPSLENAGKPLAAIELPVSRPTKVAFTPLGDCFVTSANTAVGEDAGAPSPDGALLKISRDHPAFA